MSATRLPASDIPTGAERTLDLLEPQVGRSLADVETPVAVVDLDRLDRNLRDLQSYADSHGIELWPHTKTHKSPEIGMLQLELGAGGLTVAKTGEAQVFRDAGAPDVLVHYPPFGDDKWERLARLAAAGVELTVAVDGLRRPRGSRARARAARRCTRRCSSRWTSGCTAPARRPPRGARGSRSSSRSFLPSRSPASAATRATAAATTPTIRARVDGGRRAAARDARRIPRAGPPLRPHLGRLDADALPDPRDDASTSSARARTRCSTARTASATECALCSRGDGHLRRRPGPDRDRRRLEDASPRTPSRRRQRRDRRLPGRRPAQDQRGARLRRRLERGRAAADRRPPAGRPRTTPAAASTCTTGCSRCATASSTT